MKKLWKQDRGQEKKLEKGNNLKMMFTVRTKINAEVFAILILTASGL